MQQRWDEEAAHTARTDLLGERLRRPVFWDLDETFAGVGIRTGDGPAFVGSRVLDEATFDDVFKRDGVQGGSNGIV